MKTLKLTNEELTKLFRNNFELAMYAIEIARRHIRSGHEFTLKGLLKEVQNNPLKGDLEELIKEIQEQQEREESQEDVA